MAHAYGSMRDALLHLCRVVLPAGPDITPEPIAWPRPHVAKSIPSPRTFVWRSGDHGVLEACAREAEDRPCQNPYRNHAVTLVGILVEPYPNHAAGARAQQTVAEVELRHSKTTAPKP